MLAVFDPGMRVEVTAVAGGDTVHERQCLDGGGVLEHAFIDQLERIVEALVARAYRPK
jgi:hypothetical protein